MSQDTPQREFALQVVHQLRGAGYEALWAGGCVRDQLLGRTPKDYDIATSARPEQVRNLFGHRRTLALGAAFGVIVVLGRKTEQIEVATFRSDGAYVDGRHPEGVTFTTAEQDAERRDFTINGIFYDPVEDRVIDYVCGQQDLEKNILRAIGNPEARFSEDKLRMLRAVRFATTLGFEIDKPTLEAIRAMAPQVRAVSAERTGSELRRLLVHASRKLGLELLLQTKLLEPLLPELDSLANKDLPAWQRTLQHLDELESNSLSVALAALLIECQHAKLVSEIGRRFRFTNKEIDRAVWLVQKLPEIEKAVAIPWPRLQRVLVHEGSDDLIALANAVLGPNAPGVCECRSRLNLPTEKLNPPPLLTGGDLLAHGVQSGPRFATLLSHVRDQQLLGHISTQKAALEQVDQWLNKHQNN